MMFIPPPPSSRQVGRKLGKLLATMRKLQTAAKPPPATPKHNMSTPTQRPTPETDEAEINLGSACGQFSEWYVKPDFARKIERERDEAREELENILNVIPADAPCLHAETGETVADYILGMQKEVGRVHALYFNDKQQLEAMRGAIKEAHEALTGLDQCRIFYGNSMDIDNHVTDACATARAKLQPFIKP